MEAPLCGAPVRNLYRQRPACTGVQNNHFHGSTIGGVTDIGAPALRHLASNRLCASRQATHQEALKGFTQGLENLLTPFDLIQSSQGRDRGILFNPCDHVGFPIHDFSTYLAKLWPPANVPQVR